ncbi:hypothetical protein MASR2M70_22150 [Bacillota bacterium]
MKKSRFSRELILIFALIISIPQIAFADYGGIQIDGYYDDWEDKPHTQVYNGNNPNSNKINQVSLFRDESNIYVHILFAEKYTSGIKNIKVEIETNLGGGIYKLREPEEFGLLEFSSEELPPEEARGSFEEEAPSPAEEEAIVEEAPEETVAQERMLVLAPEQSGSETRLFYVYQGNAIVGEGYMTVVNWVVTETEFYIPLSTISSQPDGITEISMKIKKLGKQIIHCVGVGSGPYLGIAISLGAAALAAAGFASIKKRRPKEAKD